MYTIQRRLYSSKVINKYNQDVKFVGCLPNIYKINFLDMNHNSNDNKSLSEDGYFDYLQPYKLSEKFKNQFHRRLWLGGSVKINYPVKNSYEKMNITLIESLDKVRNLKNKAIVSTKREIINSADNKVLLTEHRDIYYTNELHKNVESASADAFDKFEADYESDAKVFTSDEIKKFSQITENPHLIHLDAKYNCNKEGLPEKLVVQGPYLLYECIQFLTDKLNVTHVDSIEYRNNAIVFEDDTVTIKLNKTEKKLILGNKEKGSCLTLNYLL